MKLLAVEWLAVTALVLGLIITSICYQEIFSKNWKSVKAKITSVDTVDDSYTVGAGTDGAGIAYVSCLKISYEYTVNGQVLRGSRYSANKFHQKCVRTVDKSDLMSIQVPTISSEVIVWYDQDKPQISVRDKQRPLYASIVLILSAAISLGFSYYLFKKTVS